MQDSLAFIILGVVKLRKDQLIYVESRETCFLLYGTFKKENPDVMWTYCVIHREALAPKNMSPVLHDVLNGSIKVISFLKSKPLNVRLFRCLCENVGAEHTSALALFRDNTQPDVGIMIRYHLAPGHRLACKALLSRRYIQETEQTEYVSAGQGHQHLVLGVCEEGAP